MTVHTGYFGCIPGAWAIARQYIPPEVWADPTARDVLRATDLRWAEDRVRAGRAFPGDGRPRTTMPALAFFAQRWGVSTAVVSALRDSRHTWADPIWLDREAEGKATPPRWSGRKGGRRKGALKKPPRRLMDAQELLACDRRPPPLWSASCITLPMSVDVDRTSTGCASNVEQMSVECRETVEGQQSRQDQTSARCGPNMEQMLTERGVNAHARKGGTRAITDHLSQSTSHLSQGGLGGGAIDGAIILPIRPPPEPDPDEMISKASPEDSDHNEVSGGQGDESPRPEEDPRYRSADRPRLTPPEQPAVELADTGGPRHDVGVLRAMAERMWWEVFETPVQRTRGDERLLRGLAARYGRIPLERLEAASLAYLRAAKAGRAWPSDPSLKNLSDKLDRYLMWTPPSSEAEEVAEPPEEPPAEMPAPMPAHVQQALTALAGSPPGQRVWPSSAVMAWLSAHNAELHHSVYEMRAVEDGSDEDSV